MAAANYPTLDRIFIVEILRRITAIAAMNYAPNKAKYKNKNEIVEDREIEPELEKVEEPVTVSAN